MTTPILPTKTRLRDYAFSPAELNADAEVETWLTTVNDYDFVLKLIQAFRDGSTHSYDIDSKTVITPATSFIYISDAATIATLIPYLTEAAYGYNYTVNMFLAVNDAPTPSTYITAAGSGYGITSGPNSGKKCILVSWA